MNKIAIIIEREFITRVRKKSFLLLTIFVPILLVGFYAFLMWMLLRDDTQERVIAVVNESQIENPIQSINNTTFIETTAPFSRDTANVYLERTGNYAVIWINHDAMEKPAIEIFSFAQVPTELRYSIEEQLQKRIEDIKRDSILNHAGVPDLEKQLAAAKTPIHVRTLKVSEEGESKESSSEIASIIGFIAGMIIYMFIFMYASQVMKGVIEEKSNRIIEVLVSSVKPFQFLLGKIIGVAAVGLVQFFIWIILAIIGISALQMVLLPNLDLSALQDATTMAQSSMGTNLSPKQMEVIANIAKTIDIGFIVKFISCFVFFFIGGYLLYASMFAAIGAAVDNETDSQQFLTPLSIILIVGLYIGMSAMKNPESSLVFWSSFFPFTSPIVMLVRIPYGVPTWEILLSMVILVATFLFFTWLSGKIYRVGILMYGKKITWKELWKWLSY